MTQPDYDGRCGDCYHDRPHDAAAHAIEIEAYIQAHRDLHETAAGALCHEGPDGLCLLCQVEMSHCSLCQGVGYHRGNCPALKETSMIDITVELDTPNGPRIEYSPDDDAATVESAAPDGWRVDWATPAYRLATGRLRSPLVSEGK